MESTAAAVRLGVNVYALVVNRTESHLQMTSSYFCNHSIISRAKEKRLFYGGK